MEVFKSLLNILLVNAGHWACYGEVVLIARSVGWFRMKWATRCSSCGRNYPPCGLLNNELANGATGLAVIAMCKKVI
jgi:hypothetical protein